VSVFQIWGSFAKGDPDHPTTTSTFRKGQTNGPGGKTMEQLEREFADEEGEELVLMYEFDPIQRLADRDVHEHHPSESMENAMAFMVAEAFMAGWFRDRKEDDADDQAEP
jgi:hypothetical protein